ncbi:hypothetical protein [Vibrio gallaecicus]|nr:hypothetical protein [Vibrio gallaecicus]MDN3616186.1 hypothetical protein [Vibrio gallaecicus]
MTITRSGQVRSGQVRSGQVSDLPHPKHVGCISGGSMMISPQCGHRSP